MLVLLWTFIAQIAKHGSVQFLRVTGLALFHQAHFLAAIFEIFCNFTFFFFSFFPILPISM